MKTIAATILATLLVSIPVVSATYNYAVNSAILVGASAKATNGAKLRTLSDGSFVLGGYTNAATLGGATSNGNTDFLIQKYDSSMNLVWTQLAGGASADTLTGLAVDVNDNIYAVGTCSGTVDTKTNNGGVDICLFKFNSAGVKQWTTVSGGSGNESPGGVCVDATGTNVYVVGDSGFQFNGMSSIGSNPTFIAKYSASTGAIAASAWLNNYGASNEALSCKIGSDGNIVSVGDVGSGINFYGITSMGGMDATVQKFTPALVNVWNARIGGTNTDYFYDVALDSSDNVYAVGDSVPGSTYYTIPYVGQRDIVVNKVSSAGTLVWSQLLGSTGSDDGYGITIDAANNAVLVTGAVKGTFYGSVGSSSGYGATFLAILSMADGSIQYTTTLRSSANDDGRSVLVSGGTIYIVGDSAGNYGSATVNGAPDMSFLTLGAAQPPTASPTVAPTAPTASPTVAVTAAPVISDPPTFAPTDAPSFVPTNAPTEQPSFVPTSAPTEQPSFAPTAVPTGAPTEGPTAAPSFYPTATPSLAPTDAMKNDDDAPVSDGAIAGIVIGSFVFACFLLTCCWFAYAAERAEIAAQSTNIWGHAQPVRSGTTAAAPAAEQAPPSNHYSEVSTGDVEIATIVVDKERISM